MKLRLSVFLLFSLFISSVFAQDTVLVTTGWNMVGSLKAGTVPEVLSTEPPGIITTNFYGYMPSAGYNSSDTLQKGFGYWVKVSEDGKIIFEGLPPDTLFISDTVVVTDTVVVSDTVYVADTTMCGYKKVEYAGTTYHTVQIGSQCWLDRNLNVGSMIVSGVFTNQVDNDTLEKYCYNNAPSSCPIYGGLYQWNEAMQYDTTEGVQGMCPPGWHIPSSAEFVTLASTVSDNGDALKELGQGTGTNESGFSALLAGDREWSVGAFELLGTVARFWTSTMFNANSANYVQLGYGITTISFASINNNYGISIRCLED